jgi:SAM-dependent methyltransferase
MSRRPPRVHHQVRGFDRVAEMYERGRPGYPPAAVRFLVRELGLGPGRTVVELGSGTGKLTRALLPSGAAVVAIEPTAGMRRVFERELPSTLVVDGVAEAIPLPDGFADAVVAAQAFHWFRTGPALREIERVLRPGGKLGLIWNVREPATAVARRLNELLERRGELAARAPGRPWKATFERGGHGFGRLAQRSFPHSQSLRPATLVERVLSVSVIAMLRPERRREVAAEVRAILADEARDARAAVRIPYRADVYVARRVRREGGGRPASEASHRGDHTQRPHFSGLGSARPSYGPVVSSRVERTRARKPASHGTTRSPSV